jgi:hypothetical protein
MLTSVQAPAVRIEVEKTQPGSAKGQWRVTWSVLNSGSDPLALQDAWVPHGRFQGDGHVTLNTLVQPGQTTSLELTVSASEPPGTTVENAYLILRTPAWRLFARMRIEFDTYGFPHPIVEALTTQSISTQ